MIAAVVLPRHARRTDTAPDRRVGDDALPLGPTGHARTERRDRPTEISAKGVRKRQIEPTPTRAHEVVQSVQRRIAHPHPHRTRAGIGDWDVLAIFQDVGAAVPIENDCAHEIAPSTFNL